MDILIRVIVLAADMTEAVGAARFALDRLIWIGEGASTTFDYYKMLNERPPGILTSLASESQTTTRQTSSGSSTAAPSRKSCFLIPPT